MIAELLDPKASFAAVINYNERVVRKGKGEILSHHNMITFSAPERITWLEDAARVNSRIKYPVFHAALAFDYSDQLDNTVLDRIGHEYMEHMGYKDCSFLIYRHEDKKHTHIHIVGSRVDQGGKKVNDSFEQYRSESLCRNMEIKYGLRRLGEGAKPEQTPIERIQSRIWDKETPVFSRINNEMQFILKEYRPTGFEQFKSLAKQHFVDVQERREEEQRITGLVYAVIYENGLRDHKGVAGSSFRHDYSLRGLERAFAKNSGKIIPERDPRTKQNMLSEHDKAYFIQEIGAVYLQVLSRQLMTEQDFMKKLKAIGVIPLFTKNTSGYYGISFQFPAKEDLTIKGSELDRSLSFNIIKGKIVGEEASEKEIIDLVARFYKSTWNFHDSDLKLTDSSIAVFLSRIGFKFSREAGHYLLSHPALPQKPLKITVHAIEKAIKQEILSTDFVFEAGVFPDQSIPPLNTKQWKLLGFFASGDVIKMLPLLRSTEFYKSVRFSLHPEELRLFGSQIRLLEKLTSFQARLLGSIKLTYHKNSKKPKKVPVDAIKEMISLFAMAGIALFTDQKGNWFLKDYQLSEPVPLDKCPLSEKERLIFGSLLNIGGTALRSLTRSFPSDIQGTQDHRPYELLTALIKEERSTVANLEKQGITSGFSREELSLILGDQKKLAPVMDEGQRSNWDKLLNDIEALADYFLYDNWHGIKDEDQPQVIARKKKKRN